MTWPAPTSACPCPVSPPTGPSQARTVVRLQALPSPLAIWTRPTPDRNEVSAARERNQTELSDARQLCSAALNASRAQRKGHVPVQCGLLGEGAVVRRAGHVSRAPDKSARSVQCIGHSSHRRSRLVPLSNAPPSGQARQDRAEAACSVLCCVSSRGAVALLRELRTG